MPSSRLAIIALAAALLVLGAAVVRPRVAAPPSAARGSAVVTLPPAWFAYRPPGDFEANGREIDAPERATQIGAPLDVMVEPVSQADYARCAVVGACPRLRGVDPSAADRPVVGVSFLDATAYATWYARSTGEDWRLPTDLEWAYAAGERFRKDLPATANGDDFARRWLAKFDADALQANQPKAPQPFGRFGVNALGVADLAGNVWEWTQSCYERRAIESGGGASRLLTRNCQVRALEGAHRTFMSDFIRDSVTGGCSVGPPPTNLGFRLVRDRGNAITRALRSFGDALAAL